MDGWMKPQSWRSSWVLSWCDSTCTIIPLDPVTYIVYSTKCCQEWISNALKSAPMRSKADSNSGREKVKISHVMCKDQCLDMVQCHGKRGLYVAAHWNHAAPI